MKKFIFIIGVSALSLITWITEVMASMGGGIPPGPGANDWWIRWLIEHGFLH